MEDSADIGHKNSIGLLIGAAVVFLVLYFLSIGPVALALKAARATPSDASMRTANGVYAPLIWLDKNTCLKRPLEAYIRFWDGR